MSGVINFQSINYGRYLTADVNTTLQNFSFRKCNIQMSTIIRVCAPSTVIGSNPRRSTMSALHRVTDCMVTAWKTDNESHRKFRIPGILEKFPQEIGLLSIWHRRILPKINVVKRRCDPNSSPSSNVHIPAPPRRSRRTGDPLLCT